MNLDDINFHPLSPISDVLSTFIFSFENRSTVYYSFVRSSGPLYPLRLDIMIQARMLVV